MDAVIYVCAQCNKPLEGDSLQNHVCWPNVLVEPVFNGEEETDIDEGVRITADEEHNSVVTLVADGFKKKHSVKNRRGEWTEVDVHRLITVYVRNYKLLPRKDALHKHYFWDRVMKDLSPFGNFSRFLVQTKIKKLKSATKLLMRLDPNTKWPFYQEMCELMSIENDETLPLSPDYDSENDSTDDNPEVQGLRRWTVKETRHLLDVYKKHMPRMVVNGNRRKTAWNDIIADLDYDLPRRFSMIQIRSRIRNVLNTYRAIIAHKRKKQMTHWPLFKDVAELMKTEQLLFADSHVNPVVSEEFLRDDDTDPDERNFRWNLEETQELIQVYLNKLADLAAAVSDAEVAVIWEKITEQVNEIRRRKVGPHTARNKINTLRSLFQNNDEKSLGPIYDHVRTMVESERLYSNSGFKLNLPRRKRKRAAGEIVPKREIKRERTEDLPSWYVKYSEESQRRHSEKMAIHLSMIEVLEKVLRKK